MCRKIPFCVLFVGVILALIANRFFRITGEENDVVPLLISYLESQDYNMKQFTVKLSDQMYSIEALVLTLGENGYGNLICYNGDGEKIGEQALVPGEQTFALSGEMDSVTVFAEMSNDILIEGVLTEKGERQKETSEVRKGLEGKSISILGDSLSAYENYVPEGYFTYYPNGDVNTVSDMWWYRIARQNGMYICKVNASAGSGVIGLHVNENGESENRGRELHLAGHIPDMIIVWLGGNDALAGVDMERIEKAYRDILDDISECYSDAEVFLCTYIETEQSLKELNSVIRKIAEEYSVTVLDVAECGIDTENYMDYTLDGLHLNKDGFLLISAWMEQRMLEM